MSLGVMGRRPLRLMSPHVKPGRSLKEQEMSVLLSLKDTLFEPRFKAFAAPASSASASPRRHCHLKSHCRSPPSIIIKSGS